MRNINLTWIKIYIPWFIIILFSIVMGCLLGIGVGIAAKNLKHPPIQIISINEETLIKEKSLKLAKLNLNETELKKQLSEFKRAFTDLLKTLPPNFVVIRSNVLLRSDNVFDLTATFVSLLFESQNPEIKK